MNINGRGGKNIKIKPYKEFTCDDCGCVDQRNLKTIFIQLDTYLIIRDAEKENMEEWNKSLNKKLKFYIAHLNSEFFDSHSIIITDMALMNRNKHIENKKTFFTINITFFVIKQFKVNSVEAQKMMQGIFEELVDVLYQHKTEDYLEFKR